MSGVATASKTIESYEMRIVRIAKADLDQLHALSTAVGWPHRAEDWALLRQLGDGFVALDEIDRIAGSIMWFPYADRVSHIGMMITSPRLQSNGAGRWLMEHAMAALAGQSMALSATRASRHLFTSCGFLPGETIYQCQGTARISGSKVAFAADRILRPLTPGDLAAALALDQAAFGTTRQALMTDLFAQSRGYGLFRGDRLSAFSLCRPFGRGHVIGPVVAEDDDAAIAVCAPHVDAHAGRFLRLDTRLASGPFVDFVSESGLRVYDTVLAMARPPETTAKERKDRPALISYALASQALG